MFEETSHLVVFAAGLLSFFSPCILPLIPAYIMYIAGVSAEDEMKFNRKKVIIRTVSFILGFTSIFLIMGASATAVGRIFIRNRELFSKISAFIIIFFGLNLMGIIKVSKLNRVIKLKSPKNVNNIVGAYFMGVAFAAGWTPCFGPVLASILFYASSSVTMSKGISMLAIYSFGMAVPFFLTALFFTKASSLIERTEKYSPIIVKISGVIMLIFGLLIYFDKLIDISRLLL